MTMFRIKKDDDVQIITGKYKGKQGKVLRIIKDKKTGKVAKYLVEGVNLVKKHTKPNPRTNHPGGIIEKELPINSSNVQIWNPALKKGDKVGFKTLDDGRKVRFFRSNGEVIDI